MKIRILTIKTMAIVNAMIYDNFMVFHLTQQLSLDPELEISQKPWVLAL